MGDYFRVVAQVPKMPRGYVRRRVSWPTSGQHSRDDDEAAMGIDEATFRRLRQRIDAEDSGAESTV